jgi:lipid-A-disaccharide synthase
MRRYVDHVLCSLPFEARWFQEQGCNATFVGHPYFDEVRRQQLDQKFLQKHRCADRPLVTILPGSRTQELLHNLKHFIETAAIIRSRVPRVRFAVACFRPYHAQLAREMLAGSNLPIEVFVRRTPELIHLAECCLAVSGSVSLELLYQTKPTVILYWISPLAYWVQNKFRRVKYITLVNLLAADEVFPKDTTPYDPNAADADRALFPEYLTSEDKSLDMAIHIVCWLTNAGPRQQLVARLAALKAEVGHGGAARNAAEYILRCLDLRPSRIPRPHFLPAAQSSSASQANAAREGSEIAETSTTYRG